MSADPTRAAMIDALTDDAIRQEVAKSGRPLSSVAGFKRTVRENLEDGERCHPGYIALCWSELAKRRAKGQPSPARRPSPRPLDDEHYQPADEFATHRWSRLCSALVTLPGDHPLRQAAHDVAHSIDALDQARSGRLVSELERGQDDHHARQALDALEQLAITTGVNLDQPGRTLAGLGVPPPAAEPAQRRKQRGQLEAVADA